MESNKVKGFLILLFPSYFQNLQRSARHNDAISDDKILLEDLDQKFVDTAKVTLKIQSPSKVIEKNQLRMQDAPRVN